MTTQAPSNESVTTAEAQADLGKLSFTDYVEARNAGQSPEEIAEKFAPAAEKAAEQKPAAESDTAEKEAKEEEKKDESEEDADEESEESQDEAEKDDKPKKKSGAQRRKERAERAEAEVARLRKMVEEMALKGAGTPKTEPKPEDPKPEPGKDAEPNPDDFETPAAYYKALARFEIAQERKEIEAKERQSALEKEHQSLRNSHFEREKSFAAKVDDYADVIGEVAELPVSPAFEHEILSSEHGPALMYELAKNPEEFERINKLGPLAVARELGRLEAKLTAKASVPEPKPEPKKITKAPKPVEPVGQGKGSVAKSLDDPDLSFPEYERMRREQMKRMGA